VRGGVGRLLWQARATYHRTIVRRDVNVFIPFKLQNILM
jgi:hypothetical protein